MKSRERRPLADLQCPSPPSKLSAFASDDMPTKAPHRMLDSIETQQAAMLRAQT